MMKMTDFRIFVVSGMGDVVVLGGDLNCHKGEAALGYKGVHGGWAYGTRNAEGGRVLEFRETLDILYSMCF